METWDSYCPNCFSEKTDGKQHCQFCGYNEGESHNPAALPLRTILNNQYVVGRVLGNPGGFGITYLCWDTMLSTRVAIKEFIPRDNAMRDRDKCSVVAHGGKDREFFEYGLKAFLAEARTVAGFDHPNIVRVRTYFEQNHTAYLVMDYYEGVSLAEYVRQQGGRLPEKAALGIMEFILDGLRHVHDSGYLHRDIKPANIYLTNKGRVILLDFGAARYAMGEHSRSLSVVVTSGFSPFEQYSTKGKQGPWTDIYASGATLYYMLTGKPPKSAPDRVLSDTLAEPGQLLPDLPPGANKGIIQALRVKASDRLQSIEELKKILSGSPQPDPAVNIKKTDDKSDSKEKREESKKPTIPVYRSELPEADEVFICGKESKKQGIPVWRSKKAIAVAIGVCLLVLLIIVYGNWGRTGALDSWKDPVTGMVFVWVPGGCYQMGCGSWAGNCQSDEKPVHEVCVDQFWMGQTEVTQGQWQRVMGSNPSIVKEGDNYPVEHVSWEDAKEYIQKLNEMGNGKFRLPSEAEWEYAARSGGKAEKYSGGSDVYSVAWYGTEGTSTHPVKTKKSNGLGIYDMTGNVWEWCDDVYIADIYGRSDRNNPVYTGGGPNRVIRGGSWNGVPGNVRCARRLSSLPSYRSSTVGFRLLRMGLRF